MADARAHDFDLAQLLPGSFYCLGCAKRLCEGVTSLPGVLSSGCDIDTGTLSVTHDPKLLGVRDLESRVRLLAREVSEAVGHATYRLTGLD